MIIRMWKDICIHPCSRSDSHNEFSYELADEEQTGGDMMHISTTVYTGLNTHTHTHTYRDTAKGALARWGPGGRGAGTLYCSPRSHALRGAHACNKCERTGRYRFHPNYVEKQVIPHRNFRLPPWMHTLPRNIHCPL